MKLFFCSLLCILCFGGNASAQCPIDDPTIGGTWTNIPNLTRVFAIYDENGNIVGGCLGTIKLCCRQNLDGSVELYFGGVDFDPNCLGNNKVKVVDLFFDVYNAVFDEYLLDGKIPCLSPLSVPPCSSGAKKSIVLRKMTCMALDNISGDIVPCGTEDCPIEFKICISDQGTVFKEVVVTPGYSTVCPNSLFFGSTCSTTCFYPWE